MRANLGLTAVAPDRPGLADALSQSLAERGARIEEERDAGIEREIHPARLRGEEP